MPVKTRRMDMRVSREQKDLIERAALMTGQPVTSFVLSSALERARDTLERESRTALTARDWTTFVRLLAKDERPSPTLVRAAKRWRDRSG